MCLMTMDGAAIGCLSLKYSSGAEELLILYGCDASLDTLQYLANLINSAISGATSPECDVHYSSPAPMEDDLTLPALVDLDRGAACVRSLPPGPDESSLPSLEADQCKVLQRLSQSTPYAAARLASMPQVISQRVRVITGAVDGSLSISIDPVRSSWLFNPTDYPLILSFICFFVLHSLVVILSLLPGKILENLHNALRLLVYAICLSGVGYPTSIFVGTIASLLIRPQARKVTLTVGPCLWKLVWHSPWPASETSGHTEDLLGCQVCFQILVHTQNGERGCYGEKAQSVQPHYF
jgi:hypothetical protein